MHSGPRFHSRGSLEKKVIGLMIEGPRTRLVLISLALLVVLALKIFTYAEAGSVQTMVHRLQTVDLPFFNAALELKWQHYKTLELATRAATDFKTFGSEFQKLEFSKADNLAWLQEKSSEVEFGQSVTQYLSDFAKLETGVSIDNHNAIDSSQCSTWNALDCTIKVPGVETNIDITVPSSGGQTACDAIDQGLNVCQWMPDRPDAVPEPQPPNLLNKCVCYACKGKLPTVVPPEFAGTARGDDAMHQCLTDPVLQADGCDWDGVNCVPKLAKSNLKILNSTEYMTRFDNMLDMVSKVASISETHFVSQLEGFSVDLNKVFVIATICLGGAVLMGLLTSAMIAKGFGRELPYSFWGLTLLNLALVSLLFGMSMDYASQTEAFVLQLKNEDIPKQSNAWAVLFQDAVLTTSASRFVATAHNTGWVDADYTGVPGGVRVYEYWFINYIETVGELTKAIKKAQDMSQTEEDLRIFRNIEKMNRLLVDLETVALTSVQPPDASALPANDTTWGLRTMYGNSYLSAKAIYNDLNQKFLRVQTSNLVNSISKVLEGSRMRMIMSIAMDSILISFSLVIFLVRSYQLESAYLAAQKLRDASAANKAAIDDVAKVDFEIFKPQSYTLDAALDAQNIEQKENLNCVKGEIADNVKVEAELDQSVDMPYEITPRGSGWSCTILERSPRRLQSPVMTPRAPLTPTRATSRTPR